MSGQTNDFDYGLVIDKDALLRPSHDFFGSSLKPKTDSSSTHMIAILTRNEFEPNGTLRESVELNVCLYAHRVVFEDAGRFVVLKDRFGGEFGKVFESAVLPMLVACEKVAIPTPPLARLDVSVLGRWHRKGLSFLLQVLQLVAPTVAAADVPRPAESASSATHAPSASTHQGPSVQGSIQGKTESGSHQGSSGEIAPTAPAAKPELQVVGAKPTTGKSSFAAAMEQVMAGMSQVGGSHYIDLAVQPWDAMAAWMTPDQFAGYLRGNVIKYAARCEAKGGVEDLRKARHYLDKLIEVQSSTTKAEVVA